MVTMHLFDSKGQRLFFTDAERKAFMQAASRMAEDDIQTFCGVLHYTGCAMSEALALTPQHIDPASKTIILGGLTPRTQDRTRAVPVPDSLLDLMEEVHGILQVRYSEHASNPLWTHSRSKMKDRVAMIIAAAGIHGGPHAVPKGLRHGFAVHAIRNRILLTTVQEWLGHSNITTTADYVHDLKAHAPELLWDEHAEAKRMW